MSQISDEFPGAVHLIEAGYGTMAKIDSATDEELLAVEGIGPVTLEKIREIRRNPEPAIEISDSAISLSEQTEEPAEAAVASYPCPNPTCGHLIGSSPCPYCGQ